MAKLSAGEIAAVAKSAGLTTDVDIAVAIALAESGGNTQAHNGMPPDDSYGLWQINMLGSMGPARRKQFGISRNADLYDPATNARAMMQISNSGKNWRPWTTYTRGTYKLYLGKAQAEGATSGGVTPASSDSPLSKLATKLADAHFWNRIGYYILGFILILIGILLMVGKQLPVGRVAKLAKTVATQGK